MARLNLPVSGAPVHWFSGFEPGSTLSGTNGNDQLAANASNMTLAGNGGDDTFIAYDPSDVVTEPADAEVSTVETWGSGYTLPDNIRNLTLEGSGDAFAVGNTLDNIIIGNDGDDTLDGGGGDDLLIGGSGNATFVVRVGYGNDEIADFHAGDVVDLHGAAFTGFADVQAALTQSGPDTVLDLGGGQTITFDDTNAASLAADDFNLPFNPAGLTETFHDEFDSVSLDTGARSGTWKTSYYFGGRTLSGNGELEQYLDPDYAGTAAAPLGVDPFADHDGILTVSAQPTDPGVAPYIGDMPYTSGLLTTENSFSQTYGYWEIRAQLPKGDGLWPAFWLLPADHSYPPEVDVFEVLGSDPTTVYNSFHGVDGDDYQQVSHVGDLSAGFHTFGFAWSPSTMTWYVDGLQTAQTPTPAYMDKPMYMLIDLAVGGDWPGPPDASTAFPADLDIDYVHAYSLTQAAPSAPAALSTAAGATADLAMYKADTGGLQFYDIGGNAVRGASAIETIDQQWDLGGRGDFSGQSIGDLLLRDPRSEDFYTFSIGDDQVTGRSDLGNVGANWELLGVVEFSSIAGETDMLLRDTNNGDLQYVDIADNQVYAAGPMGNIGTEWQVLGFGDFSSSPGETDMLMRDTNNGDLQYFDIADNQVYQAGPMGNIGMEWQVLGVGDFSSNPGETDMLMRDANSGDLQYFDIADNQVYQAGPMGNIGMEWQVLGFGNLGGNANETDMLMRDTSNGDLQYFDIAHNQVYAAGSMGNIGTEWQSFGITPLGS
ncbi:MAG TPA: glycoside hydrolase family 16 protein [Stellaceae bacterium]|nr:glycoside hydrolase family 16 protein [Stellaceae bacterium]